MAKGTRAYAGCNGKGDDRMHSMSEWNRVYGNLVMMEDTLHEHGIVNSLHLLIVRVLMMLVEDKIKEMAE